jgi:hypothetical protein
MSETDKIWSQLNKKYGSTATYRSSLLPEKETITKVLGLLALLMCAKALYDKYQEYESTGEDMSEMLGDTSLEAILKSSVFGFVFVCVLKALSEKVVTLTEDVKTKIENSTPISNLPIPTTSMPLIAALLVGEAAELVLDSQFSDDVGMFNLGHLTGILSGIAVCGFLDI